MGNIIRLDENGHLLVDGQRTNSVTSIPAMVVLVIDRSGSMAGDKTHFASSGAWDFSQSALTKGYRVAVIDFATGAKIACAPSRKLTEVQRGCFVASLTGSTQMHEGLRLASSFELGSGDTIVVVTDGAVDDPAGTLALGSKLKASGVEILTIGTDDADKKFLSKLASRPDLGIKVQSSHLRQAITYASRLLGTSRR
jgi:Ca-activated chloride channel homolog